MILSDLLPALKERGADVRLLVYDETRSRYEGNLMQQQIPLLSMGCRNKYSPGIISGLHQEIARADIAHIHLSPALYQAPVASYDLRTPLVYTVHARNSDSMLHRLMGKWALSKYAAITVPGEAIGRQLENWLGDDRGTRRKLRVIRDGINLDRLANVRRAPGFGTEHRVITMVSGFDKTKDQMTLLRALPLVTDPKVFVAFIGEGPELDAHRAYARSLGVADRVRFLGMRDDVPSLIAGSTIGVQSSHSEVFALAALQFMGQGKPVVGSDIPGVAEIIGDPQLLYTPHDETRLAALINHLLNDSSFYREKSESCLARSLEFSVDEMADQCMALYEELIRSAR
ncbi:MAG: glycosyltransferase family 4 protein [Muribaculaceae bacterium]|nr:glycosyltransferase family 4 protein [Muribaculaceae bacterium]